MQAFTLREGVLHSIVELEFPDEPGREEGWGGKIGWDSAPHTLHPFAIVFVTFPLWPNLRTSTPVIRIQ